MNLRTGAKPTYPTLPYPTLPYPTLPYPTYLPTYPPLFFPGRTESVAIKQNVKAPEIPVEDDSSAGGVV